MAQFETKSPTPTYLSLPRLEKALELASTRNLTSVSSSIFKTYGFGDSDAALAVNTFKFLNLIDDSGEATELMPKLHLQGEPRKKVMEQIVRDAYKKLFEAVPSPQDLSLQDLMNELVIHYQLTPRLVRSAALGFQKLAELGGLREEGSVKGRAPRDGAQLKRQVKQTKSSIETTFSKPAQRTPNESDANTGLSAIKVAEGRMVLYVPADLKDRLLDDEALGEDWSTLRKALKGFADAHIPIADEANKNANDDEKS